MIIGHQEQWRYLVESAKRKKVAHAYLFYGPEGVGKKKVAFEFAKFLNCQKKNSFEPCHSCSFCYQIEEKIWPYFIYLSPDPQKDIISIEEIRELKKRLSLLAPEEVWKVAVIDQAHKLSFDAQSALLKQLEEPGKKTLIILVSEYPFLLLPTIVSRCQQIEFFLIKEEELEEKVFGEKDLEFLKGKIGTLIKLSREQRNLEEIKKRIEEIKNLRGKSLEEKFEYAKRIAKEKDFIKILEIWLVYFWDLMHKALSQKDNQTFWKKEKIVQFLKKLQEVYYLVTTSTVNQQLALELLFLDI